MLRESVDPEKEVVIVSTKKDVWRYKDVLSVHTDHEEGLVIVRFADGRFLWFQTRNLISIGVSK